MKNFFLAIILLTGISLFAQTEKGATPLPQSSIVNPKSSITRAVVIGISDYYDNQIPDLKYADRDAEAFAAWLQSPAGGSLTKDQIVLLTNAKATTAQFSAALDWLIEQSKEGDQAIIYFSGHGDVETKTIMNWGFLLTYTSPPTNYIAGAFPIYYLQSVIATLSQKNVKVVMISDACHAGKLAGSEFGGTQATALNLSKQFANEVKIMSCQPDEFSMEGEQWGGGRGAFSFHLIEGLTGLADKNGDGTVKLLEIENYLEEILPKETAPQSQIPMTVGSKSSMVALVDAASLVQLRQRKSTEMPTLAKVETKGFEETLLEKVDTTLQEMYDAFLAAIERGDLLEPPGKSANDLYELLIKAESLAPLYGFMKRNLAAALHDKAQVVLNLYLKTDTAEINKRFRQDSSYFKYPQLLSRAADLLGESHYMYRNLRGKQYYFEGLLIRLQRDLRWVEGSLVIGTDEFTTATKESLEFQRKALELENRAAFIYHEMGMLNSQLRNIETALENSQKAVEISPNWGLAMNQLGGMYANLGRNQEAEETYKKALQISPDYPVIYSGLGNLYLQLHRYEEAKVWLEKALELDSNNVSSLSRLAGYHSNLSEHEEAEKIYKKLISLQPNKKLNYYNLGYSLLQLKKNKEAIEALKIVADTLSAYPGMYSHAFIGLAKIEMGDTKEGMAILQRMVDLRPNDLSLVSSFCQGYIKMKRYGDASRKFDEMLQMAKDERFPIKNVADYIFWTYAVEGETELALQWLEPMLQGGWDDYENLRLDRTLADMRKTQNFKDLMREYFPEKSKD